MDLSESIVSSRISGAMNYPSTTQALFALIVMIIVLLFILVYCCWGTFSCARPDNATTTDDGASGSQQETVLQQGSRGSQMVIVPFSNMIYVGDPESRRIYQIPIDQDKPPAYTEVYNGGPPPPYFSDNGNRETTAPTPLDITSETTNSLPDLPPSYEDCLFFPATNPQPPTESNEVDQQVQSDLNNDTVIHIPNSNDLSEEHQDQSVALELSPASPDDAMLRSTTDTTSTGDATVNNTENSSTSHVSQNTSPN